MKFGRAPATRKTFPYNRLYPLCELSSKTVLTTDKTQPPCPANQTRFLSQTIDLHSNSLVGGHTPAASHPIPFYPRHSFSTAIASGKPLSDARPQLVPKIRLIINDSLASFGRITSKWGHNHGQQVLASSLIEVY